jgi:hypothetical protein
MLATEFPFFKLEPTTLNFTDVVDIPIVADPFHWLNEAVGSPPPRE